MRQKLVAIALALALFATWVGSAAAMGGGTGWVP
jgi:hypothetical protein